MSHYAEVCLVPLVLAYDPENGTTERAACHHQVLLCAGAKCSGNFEIVESNFCRAQNGEKIKFIYWFYELKSGVTYFAEAGFLVQPTICKTAEDVDQVKNHVSNMLGLYYII
jgi:hypothetical protein